MTLVYKVGRARVT